MTGLRHIADELEPEVWDWEAFSHWVAVWPIDESSRPDGPCMSGQALTTQRPGQDGLTPPGRVTH